MRQLAPSAFASQQPHRLTLRERAALVALASLAACAPASVVRLDGDPPEAAPLTSPYQALDPCADGVRRFVDAARAGNWELAWAALSQGTRQALQARAQVLGLQGIDLLRPLPGDADLGARRLHIGDPLAVFALADAAAYTTPTSPWPVEQPYDGRRLEGQVTVRGRSGAARTVVVAFEGAGWRVHDPRLQGAPPLAAPPAEPPPSPAPRPGAAPDAPTGAP